MKINDIWIYIVFFLGFDLYLFNVYFTLYKTLTRNLGTP